MTTEKELDNWAKESLLILKKYNYIEEDNPKRSWLPISLIIVGILLAGAIFYGIQKDAFKSNFNQEIEPNVSVNTANQYDFNPSISNPVSNSYQNQYNYTIINNIIIPVNP